MKKHVSFKVTEEPIKCPVCGSNRIANIMYGLPAYSKQLMQEIKAGKIALGGCCIGDDDPVWQCADCECKFYLKSKSGYKSTGRN